MKKFILSLIIVLIPCVSFAAWDLIPGGSRPYTPDIPGNIGTTTPGTSVFTTSTITNLKNSSGITTTAPAAASLLTNGAMTSTITGWSGANWAWDAANGGCALHTSGAATALTSDQAVVSGRSYLATYTVILTSGTSVTMSVGGLTDSARTTSGTYTYYGTTTATTAMAFTPSSNFVGAVNLVSLQAMGPTITTCGTAPALARGSSNVAGFVTTGSGAPTACTLTYATAFTNTPACIITPATGVMPSITTKSNAAWTTTFSATTTGFHYHCIGLNE